MKTTEINHRQYGLYRGAAMRHLLSEVSNRLGDDLVSDVVTEMHAAPHARRLNDREYEEHKAKQKVLCSHCYRPITMDDVQLNECANCGHELIKKGRAK